MHVIRNIRLVEYLSLLATTRNPGIPKRELLGKQVSVPDSRWMVLNHKPSALAQCGSGVVKDRRHRGGDIVRDQQLVILSEARGVRFTLTYVKRSVVNSTVIRIETDIFISEAKS
ncbi:hypothetical protein EVAR_84419_1 [Eumeta japonica]|uniref:Uncharacterized protein n=1 Tax=Eumeta variegata TaxID=151549 RepID=A0A4C1W0V2_EUMVA|nr:hypothetical protein EVAR_84419_1 [Eumeta japonica]